MAIIGTAITVLGAIVPILAQFFSSLHEQFPNATWITSIAGALMATAPVVTYILSRGSVKSTQLKAGAASDIATATTALKAANP